MDEAGLFTLRFVITGLSTKKAAEICNTSEKTYKKWESTRIYPIDALHLIWANAMNKTQEQSQADAEETTDEEVLQPEIKPSTVIKFPG